MLVRPRFALSLLASLLVAACSHMPVTSMVKLARVDFETSDPAQLRAAVKLPNGLRPLPNGMVLRIAVKAGKAPEQSRDFALRELPEVPELAADAGRNAHIFAYRLDDPEVSRLNAFRAELLALKSKGHGSITISVLPQACTTSDLPEGPVYFTTYLRTAETIDYVVLARDVDLRTLMPSRVIVDEIPPCGPH